MKTLLTSFVICLFAFPALADTSPSVDAGIQAGDPIAAASEAIDIAVKDIDADPAATISELIELAKSGRWGPFAGLALMFLVWAFRKFFWKLINKNVLPWLTLALGMAVAVGVGLVAGNIWWKVLIDGLITGGSAMALWSALFKHLLGEKKKK